MRHMKTTDRFSITDLSLYFDTVAKDRLDSGAVGHRNGEILDLRDQMLRLTDTEFVVLMRSFRAAVKEAVGARGPHAEANRSIPKEQANQMYEAVRSGGSGASTKISVVS